MRQFKFWVRKMLFLTGAYTYMRPCRAKAFIYTFARSIH
jgi:hypothetical protein